MKLQISNTLRGIALCIILLGCNGSQSSTTTPENTEGETPAFEIVEGTLEDSSVTADSELSPPVATPDSLFAPDTTSNENTNNTGAEQESVTTPPPNPDDTAVTPPEEPAHPEEPALVEAPPPTPPTMEVETSAPPADAWQPRQFSELEIELAQAGHEHPDAIRHMEQQRFDFTRCDQPPQTGKQYYVHAPTLCSDSGEGSQKDPWCGYDTIDWELLQPGSTLYFCGEFTERLKILNAAPNGTADAKVHLRGDCEAAPAHFKGGIQFGEDDRGKSHYCAQDIHITGSNLRIAQRSSHNTFTNVTIDEGQVNDNGISVAFRNLTIRNDDPNIGVEIRGIDQMNKQPGYPRSSTYVDGCNISNMSQSGIHLRYNEDVRILNCTIENPKVYGIFVDGHHGQGTTRIIGNHIYANPAAFDATTGVKSVGQRGAIAFSSSVSAEADHLESNFVMGAQEIGFNSLSGFGYDGLLFEVGLANGQLHIHNNAIHNNYSTGINIQRTWSNPVLIEHNLIAHNTLPDCEKCTFKNTITSQGIYLHESATQLTARRNLLISNGPANPKYFDGTNSNIAPDQPIIARAYGGITYGVHRHRSLPENDIELVIQENIIRDNTGAGVQIEGITGNLHIGKITLTNNLFDKQDEHLRLTNIADQDLVMFDNFYCGTTTHDTRRGYLTRDDTVSALHTPLDYKYEWFPKKQQSEYASITHTSQFNAECQK